jgi:hypothetical protein
MRRPERRRFCAERRVWRAVSAQPPNATRARSLASLVKARRFGMTMGWVGFFPGLRRRLSLHDSCDFVLMALGGLNVRGELALELFQVVGGSAGRSRISVRRAAASQPWSVFSRRRSHRPTMAASLLTISWARAALERSRSDSDCIRRNPCGRSFQECCRSTMG